MMKKPHRDFKMPPQPEPTTNLFPREFRRHQILTAMARREKWTRGAEIGLNEGRTLANMLIKLPNLYMVGVDPWVPQPDNPGPESWADWDHDTAEARCRSRVAPFADRVLIIKNFSHVAAKQIEDGSLDFVFIDGDHSYEGCKIDIACWEPKIRSGGWMTGHDINWPGVRKAVDERFRTYEIAPDAVWMVRMEG